MAFQPGTEGDSPGAQDLCKSKRATCQKPIKRDWASDRTCLGSERRVRLELWLNYGLESGTDRDSLGARTCAKSKRATCQKPTNSDRASGSTCWVSRADLGLG